MKINIFKTMVVFISSLFVLSCEEEDTANVSEVTYYANITVEGPAFTSIVAGEEEFEDPGATAEAGGTTLEVEKSGSVDSGTPGVYTLTYTAVNDDGYSSSQTRTVLVTSENISDVDLSGSYEGTSATFGTSTATVTKLGNGYYRCDKALASSNNIPVEFFHLGGDDIIVPGTSTSFGLVNSTAEDTNATLTENGFQWTLFVSCCGNFGPITFTKQ